MAAPTLPTCPTCGTDQPACAGGEPTVEELLAALRAKAALVPELDWLTGNARDLVVIAVVWGGFDPKAVVRRLAAVKSTGERLNARTVERVLGEERATWQ